MLEKLFTVDYIIGFIYFIFPIGLSIYEIINVKKSKFFYYENTSIKLHDEITKDIEDLEIKYKGDKVNSNLKLVKGSFLLSSINDVRGDEIDKELCIYSKDKNALWKFFKIIDSSENFDPTFRVDNNKVYLNKSLFKSNDFVTFTGIIDSSEDSFYVSQRIYNVETKVEKFTESDKKTIQTNLFSSLIILFVFILSYIMPHIIISQDKDDKPFISDYEAIYFKNENKINLDSLKRQFKLLDEFKKKEFKSEMKLHGDSLLAIFKNNPSCENEIEILKWSYDTQAKQMALDLSAFMNNSDISLFTDELLLRLYDNNNIDTLKTHIYNDSIKIRFQVIKNPKAKAVKGKIDFFNIFYYILIVFIIFYVIRQILRLNKLIKLINILKESSKSVK